MEPRGRKDALATCLTLANEYDGQREIVMDAARLGSKAAHSLALDELAAIAAKLHNAERAAGVPVGSTRNPE